ncbi:MAG: sugar phosphate isomerase/epimerase family protein [Terriglobales bacterium]
MRRRVFLKTVGVAAAMSGLASGTGVASVVAKTTEKNDGHGKPRLLVGCCAYSYAKYFEAGKITMEDFFRKAVELEVRGVDVTTYWLKSTEPEYLNSLRHLAFKNGLGFSGAAIRTEMCQSDPAKRAGQVQNIQHWTDATDRLGASHLRVFTGDIPPGATAEQGIKWVVEVMKPVCEYAGQRGITVGIEDHHGLTARAAEIVEIMRQLDSPYAGINLDVSNFEAPTDEQMYSDIAACIPYATHVHIRDHFESSGHPIDLDRVWQMFAGGGYRGYMSVEYEGEEDAMTGVPKLVETVKALCHKYSSV